MSRISDILIRVRDSLADTEVERWTDKRLIRLIDDAQKDIARHSRLLKGDYEFSLQEGVHTYQLPDNLWLITRAAFNGYKIPAFSYDNMDEQARSGTNNMIAGSIWEQRAGSAIEAVVYDNRDNDVIRVYPIPNEAIAENDYTFENAGTVVFDGDEMLGEVTEITDYTMDSVYGITTSLYDPFIETENFLQDLGVVTSMNEASATVQLWYIRTANTVTSVDSVLEIPSVFDAAIKYYVIGSAYLDDNDTAYRQKGQETMQMYDRELSLAKVTSALDGVSSPTNLSTSYRSAF